MRGGCPRSRFLPRGVQTGRPRAAHFSCARRGVVARRDRRERRDRFPPTQPDNPHSFAHAAPRLLRRPQHLRIGHAVITDPPRRGHALVKGVIAAVVAPIRRAQIRAPGRRLSPCARAAVRASSCPAPATATRATAIFSASCRRRRSSAMVSPLCFRPAMMTGSSRPGNRAHTAASRRLVTIRLSRQAHWRKLGSTRSAKGEAR